MCSAAVGSERKPRPTGRKQGLLPRRCSVAPGEYLGVSLTGKVAPVAHCAEQGPPTSGRTPAQSGQHEVQAVIKSYAIYTP